MLQISTLHIRIEVPSLQLLLWASGVGNSKLQVSEKLPRERETGCGRQLSKFCGCDCCILPPQTLKRVIVAPIGAPGRLMTILRGVEHRSTNEKAGGRSRRGL